MAEIPLLDARHLKKAYGAQLVVDDLSLTLSPGICLGLLGPNGAGKTTTLKLCLGLVAPDSGEISLAGYPIPKKAQTARKRLGVVPQFDNLDPDFSVVENLLIFGHYFGMSARETEARIPWLLHFSGLENKRDTRIETLSGGMKRRLTLARALVNDPDILFLDEPTTGLDPQARRLIWERLRQLKASGKTLLLTTHFMEEAQRLCNTLIIIDKGRKIAEGSPQELIAQHIEPQVIEVSDEMSGTLGSFVEKERHNSDRVEINGETAFFYCHNPLALLEALSRQSELRYIHRASNLEDVFIKLTGHELRD